MVINERPVARLMAVFGKVRVETTLDGGYFIPHLQKFSRAGIMLNLFKRKWPFCLHVWFFWKKQEWSLNPSNEISFVPGSECGFYARTPGWREGRDGIEWTWGYAGGRWD